MKICFYPLTLSLNLHSNIAMREKALFYQSPLTPLSALSFSEFKR